MKTVTIKVRKNTRTGHTTAVVRTGDQDIIINSGHDWSVVAGISDELGKILYPSGAGK